MLPRQAVDNLTMSRLREPIPAGQAFALVFTAVAYIVAQRWTGRLSPGTFLVLLGVLEFLVQPISCLLHELGHGFAACRLGAKSASIMVGRGPWMRFSLGRIRVNFSLLPTWGVMCRGVCRYQAEGLSWRSRALIALSGPAATALELLAGLALAPALWHGAGTFERNVIVFALVGLLCSLVVNLSPMTMTRGGKAVVVGNDGTIARVALQRYRQRVPLPAAKSPEPESVTSPAAVPAATGAERDSTRTRASIPPPSYRG